jgi:hypothetical protein
MYIKAANQEQRFYIESKSKGMAFSCCQKKNGWLRLAPILQEQLTPVDWIGAWKLQI